MNIKKHLNINLKLFCVIFVFNVIADVICFIIMIRGEGVIPFLISLILSIFAYLVVVLLRVIIDFYSEIVTKYKTSDKISEIVEKNEE